MRKRLGTVALVLALALMIAVPTALARGGPFGMFWGSVWVDAIGPDWVDFDHIVFNARVGHDNRPDNGHFFVKSSGSATFDHRVDLDDVRTTGYTPTGIPLGVPTEYGVCAFASGHYSGPIEDANFLCILVCKETPGDGYTFDMILLVPSVDRTDFDTMLGMYFFIVVDGNFVLN